MAGSAIFSIHGFQARGLSFTYPTPRKLDELVKVPLLLMEDADKISEIWDNYHKDRPGVFAGVLKGKRKFEVLMQRGKKCPRFMYPIKSLGDDKGGFFVLVSEFQGKHCLFTSYEDLVDKKDQAQPHLVVTFYDELISEKDIVLVRTDICNPALSDEATRKVNRALLTSYLTSQGYEMVDKFNHEPREFPVEEYLQNQDNHL
eukprot:CAMPEP_0197528988 /NCGR_PEP_ID=MMETSP1318-20131121/26966_1 /TAXON_ID=552666 /ORGANISM="Partenskyella glossopodia, Strain RCC365" /LENGTH=201 /DNA_ID=CAMNT_0043084297 /DNA_START=21 /DNA_END=626 /DNA_ORIENTATION=-